MGYSEDYQHPKWQEKRLRIMERDGFQCSNCSDKESKLNVHHNYYYPGRKPWEYPDGSLETLCDECHSMKHDKYDEEDEQFVDFFFRPISDASCAYELMAGWEAINFIRWPESSLIANLLWEHLAERSGDPYDLLKFFISNKDKSYRKSLREIAIKYIKDKDCDNG